MITNTLLYVYNTEICIPGRGSGETREEREKRVGVKREGDNIYRHIETEREKEYQHLAARYLLPLAIVH